MNHPLTIVHIFRLLIEKERGLKEVSEQRDWLEQEKASLLEQLEVANAHATETKAIEYYKEKLAQQKEGFEQGFVE